MVNNIHNTRITIIAVIGILKGSDGNELGRECTCCGRNLDKTAYIVATDKGEHTLGTGCYKKHRYGITGRLTSAQKRKAISESVEAGKVAQHAKIKTLVGWLVADFNEMDDLEFFQYRNKIQGISRGALGRSTAQKSNGNELSPEEWRGYTADYIVNRKVIFGDTFPTYA